MTSTTAMDLTKYEPCSECGGYGVVSDYGATGDDFYGPKDCQSCKGRGLVRRRNRGRFV